MKNEAWNFIPRIDPLSELRNQFLHHSNKNRTCQNAAERVLSSMNHFPGKPPSWSESTPDNFLFVHAAELDWQDFQVHALYIRFDELVCAPQARWCKSLNEITGWSNMFLTMRFCGLFSSVVYPNSFRNRKNQLIKLDKALKNPEWSLIASHARRRTS